jgi:hypothetical protein
MIMPAVTDRSIPLMKGGLNHRAEVLRLPALDFTKGVLVLIMVLYHWLNYFVGTNLDYRYLRFLTPSFIFVAGFLISFVYLSRHSFPDARLSKRLLVRGLKLLAIFVVLNAFRDVLLSKFSSVGLVADQLSLENIQEVLVVGSVPVVTSKIVAFYILVPISYLLIFSGVLVYPYRFWKYTFHAVFVLLILCIFVLALNGRSSANLEFVTIGLLGALAGFIPIQKINSFVEHTYLLIASYVAYIAAITVWNVPFALLAAGVCLTLWAIYRIGLLAAEPGRIQRHVILLGKHSLFGYIAQIAILQVLRMGLRHVDAELGVTEISFVGAFALTMAAVETLEFIKSRSVTVDRLYKAAFA